MLSAPPPARPFGRSFAPHFIVLLVLLLVVFVLPGCGSGRRAPAPSPVTSTLPNGDPGALVPNYLSSIAPARWRGRRITWRIVQGGNSSVPGVNIEKAVAAGINEWQSTLAASRFGLLVEKAGDSETPNVTIALVQSRDLGESQLGDCEPVTDAEGFIVSAPIRIQKSLLPSRMKDAVAHEWGHALGVRGHSPYASDLMYRDVGLFRVPSQRDVNTISTIYNAPDARNSY